MKSETRKFLEPSGPLQARNGAALPLLRQPGVNPIAVNKNTNKKRIPHFYRPKHTTVPTSETNSWGLLSISCKAFSDIATYDTVLYHLMWIKCVYFSPVTLIYLWYALRESYNISANEFQNLHTTLSTQIWLNFSTTCWTCDHLWWPQTSAPTSATHGYSRLQ